MSAQIYTIAILLLGTSVVNSQFYDLLKALRPGVTHSLSDFSSNYDTQRQDFGKEERRRNFAKDVVKKPQSGYQSNQGSRGSNNYMTYQSEEYRPNNYNSYTTQKPYYTSESQQDYTTHNPLLHRPGVMPAATANKIPITNRPIYKPLIQTPSVTASSDDGPKLLTAVDEDSMSNAEKRRLIEVAESMCDQYKALDVKKLQAIPLLPSPEPVEFNVSKCNRNNIPLVVGGKITTIEEFPHMALIGWQKLEGYGYSWKCGGSLISNLYVLTAAHCVFQERDNTVVTGTPRAVQLGSTYLDDPGALVIKISSATRHPKFKLPKSYYDIALVKLAQRVTFSSKIKPACLGVPPPVGEHIIATGWGRTEFGGEQSAELRSVSVPVWSHERCTQALGTSRKLPDGVDENSQMCAGDKKGFKDACQGDSGGPAQIQDGCSWRVVGVTSVGRSCGAPNTPGVYATVQIAFISAIAFADHKNSNNNLHNTHNNNKNTNKNPYNNNQNTNNYNTYDNDRNTNYNENYHQNTYNNDQNTNNNRYNKNNNNRVYNSQDSYSTPLQNNIDNQYYNNQDTLNNNNDHTRKRYEDQYDRPPVWST